LIARTVELAREAGCSKIELMSGAVRGVSVLPGAGVSSVPEPLTPIRILGAWPIRDE
jgi:hypothetical protein